MSDRIPLPMPFGWFRVSDSDELARGEARAERYAGRDLVVWRDEEGAPHVLDAHCPHLGAHLGVGGRVEGTGLRCPFHAWKFAGDGRCLEVPYAKRIPPQARVGAYPVSESNGIVMFWYHPHDAPPQWEVPDVPELRSEAWLPPRDRSTARRT